MDIVGWKSRRWYIRAGDLIRLGPILETCLKDPSDIGSDVGGGCERIL